MRTCKRTAYCTMLVVVATQGKFTCYHPQPHAMLGTASNW